MKFLKSCATYRGCHSDSLKVTTRMSNTYKFLSMLRGIMRFRAHACIESPYVYVAVRYTEDRTAASPAPQFCLWEDGSVAILQT